MQYRNPSWSYKMLRRYLHTICWGILVDFNYVSSEVSYIWWSSTVHGWTLLPVAKSCSCSCSWLYVFDSFLSQGKGPCTRGIGGTASHILELGHQIGWVVSFTPWPLYPPWKEPFGTHWLGCWVGLRASLDAGEKRDIGRLNIRILNLISNVPGNSRNLGIP
jgi:hypothetical protein